MFKTSKCKIRTQVKCSYYNLMMYFEPVPIVFIPKWITLTFNSRLDRINLEAFVLVKSTWFHTHTHTDAKEEEMFSTKYINSKPSCVPWIIIFVLPFFSISLHLLCRLFNVFFFFSFFFSSYKFSLLYQNLKSAV